MNSLFINQSELVTSVSLSPEKNELIVYFINGIVHHNVAKDEGSFYHCDGCRYFNWWDYPARCDLGEPDPKTFCENIDGKGKKIIWIRKEGSDHNEISEFS
jgi:hypothetical protein